MALIEVTELIRREDGSVCGLGNSLLLEEAEASKLVSAGTHKYPDVPLGSSPAKKKKSEQITEAGEAVEDGSN